MKEKIKPFPPTKTAVGFSWTHRWVLEYMGYRVRFVSRDETVQLTALTPSSIKQSLVRSVSDEAIPDNCRASSFCCASLSNLSHQSGEAKTFSKVSNVNRTMACGNS